MKLKEILQQFPHFSDTLAGLPEDIELHIERFPAHTIIVQKDDPIDKVMIVSAGDMTVYNIYESGEIIFIQSEEISFIGDIELLSHIDHYICSIVTNGECSAISMSIRDYLRWFETDRDLAKETAVRLAKRNCTQAQKIGSLKYHSTEYRVAKYLTDMVRDQLKTEDRAIIEITREVLAFNVGASERMINRIISNMKDHNYLTTGYGTITISKSQFDHFSHLLKSIS